MEVTEALPLEEILAHLAEEASELAQAALKLRRALGRTGNPTPKSAAEAFDELCEEIADVRLCVELIPGVDGMKIAQAMCYKLGRWESRLERKQETP